MNLRIEIMFALTPTLPMNLKPPTNLPTLPQEREKHSPPSAAFRRFAVAAAGSFSIRRNLCATLRCPFRHTYGKIDLEQQNKLRAFEIDRSEAGVIFAQTFV